MLCCLAFGLGRTVIDVFGLDHCVPDGTSVIVLSSGFVGWVEPIGVRHIAKQVASLPPPLGVGPFTRLYLFSLELYVGFKEYLQIGIKVA